MIVYDPANGLAVSMPGVSNHLVDTTTATGGTNEGNFNWANLTDWNLTTYPSNLVATSWYAVVTGNMNPNIVANADWNGRVVFNNRGVVYDNDETPYSGTATPAVRCSGALTQSNLMTTAQAAVIGTRASLTHVSAVGVANTTSVAGTGAYLVKQQVIPVAGYPGGKIGLMHLEQSSAWLPLGSVAP
jgi:hypothetical protein